MDENLNNNNANNNASNFNASQSNNDLFSDKPNPDLNNQVNPVEQNTEENPYYNPYFQGNDNSPYMNVPESSVNNDIYNQSYMNMYSSGSNSQETNDASNTNMSEKNQVDNSINLFDMDNDDQSLNNNSTVNNISTQNNIPVQDNMSTQNNTFAQDNMSTQNNTFAQDNMSTQDNTFAQDNMSTQNNTFAQDNMSTQNNTFAQPNIPTQENPSMNINPILNSNFNTIENSNQTDFNMSGNIETDQQSIDNSQFNSNQTTQNTFGSNNDEEFKKSWMGKLYDKANRRKFSIPAFFFGGLYYLYRKLYLFGFIFVIISCIIPIIGINMISSSLLNATTFSAPNLLMPALFTFIMPIIINLIYAFVFYPLYKSNVNKKLEKYKNEAQSPAQLLDLAKQKGGTSVPFVLLGILVSVVVSSVILTTLLASTLSQVIDGLLNGFAVPKNQLNDNTVVDENDIYTPTYDAYYFYNDYYFEYDASKWLANEDKNLSYENYTLAYIQSIENLTSVGFDINQNDGRASFFTYLYNLFSSQIDATSTTLELGSSSFVYDNGIYYSFIDLVYTASIERCYFVLIPENDIFIEFILSNNDTVISDEIHNEVVSYICSIQEDQATNTSGNIDTDIVNGLDSNNVSTPSADSNTVTSQANTISSANDIEPQTSTGNTTNTNNYQTSENNSIESSQGGLTVVSNTASNSVSVMFNTAQ